MKTRHASKTALEIKNKGILALCGLRVYDVYNKISFEYSGVTCKKCRLEYAMYTLGKLP
jgi:hypothetical protein